MIRNNRGLFVVLEGLDGAGTTTQGDLLAQYFSRSKKKKVYFTREPSDGPVGMLIRLALAGRLVGPNALREEEKSENEAGASLDPRTMALLFAADRSDHIATRIESLLDKGQIVICDRYILSSLAYQGIDVPIDWLLQLNRTFIKPDLTIYLDIQPNQAEFRMRSARWGRDLYEDEWLLERVRAKYLELIENHSDLLGKVSVLDGAMKPREIAAQIRMLVETTLGIPSEPTAQQASLRLE